MDNSNQLIRHFAIRGINDKSAALVNRLLDSDLQGRELQDALASLVMKHPNVVGAAYDDPGGSYWDYDGDANMIYDYGCNPTRRKHAQNAYEGWAEWHGLSCPKWPEEVLRLADRFALRGINEESRALYDQLLGSNLQGAELHDALATLVMTYPGVVGAAYKDPEALCRDPVEEPPARWMRYPTKRELAQKEYESWAWRRGEDWARRHLLPDWSASVDQKEALERTTLNQAKAETQRHDRQPGLAPAAAHVDVLASGLSDHVTAGQRAGKRVRGRRR